MCVCVCWLTKLRTCTYTHKPADSFQPEAGTKREGRGCAYVSEDMGRGKGWRRTTVCTHRVCGRHPDFFSFLYKLERAFMLEDMVMGLR